MFKAYLFELDLILFKILQIKNIPRHLYRWHLLLIMASPVQSDWNERAPICTKNVGNLIGYEHVWPDFEWRQPYAKAQIDLTKVTSDQSTEEAYLPTCKFDPYTRLPMQNENYGHLHKILFQYNLDFS